MANIFSDNVSVLLNNGDGTFTDVSEGSGLEDSRWSLSAPWLDYDLDGDLDVFVAKIIEEIEEGTHDRAAA